MSDPLYKPYVALIRDRRIDIAGPFVTRAAAVDWMDRWKDWANDARCHVVLLRDFDVSALLSQRVSNAADLARVCAPCGLDADAARDWSAANAHSFLYGFPPTGIRDTAEEIG
ncbi:hypothetical protein UFOVP843_44 [uncultured Caudovirales phage]|uniref:Uncharacterized protein n=1 Tax=uncultured Caudovirales phage TaxID=2100421 RepID=A0A6J5PLH9_9CAUD|nr:hypothetical protein UFOVP843_44 [uncultured Caudovirales phage]CAB4172433.1 hypothetical protein UFOVP936_16 [uncultured Caudovirales phage]